MSNAKRESDVDPADERVVKRIQLNPVGAEDDQTNHTEQTQDMSIDKRKRRKFALLLSYCGMGYFGMQKNQGHHTIEGDLFAAMLKADLVNELCCRCPQLFEFQRAARTDKGVSAAKQVVSIKLPEDIPDIASAINAHLPEKIRVISARRTTRGFNSKNWCDCRTYSYMCPTFAFAPVENVTNEKYRITPEVLAEVKGIMSMYLGTHNFHNFTARKKPDDPSSKRFMLEINCSDPFERQCMEWIIIKIKGQSFMLHQIRKMVGLVIAICKGFCGTDLINKAWEAKRVDIPIAPGLGLVLEELHYDLYNKRYGKDGIHETLLWEEEAVNIQSFRERFIDAGIVEVELRDRVMLTWLATLPMHIYNVRDDGDPTLEELSQRRSAVGLAHMNLLRSKIENDGIEKSSSEDAEDEENSASSTLVISQVS